MLGQWPAKLNGGSSLDRLIVLNVSLVAVVQPGKVSSETWPDRARRRNISGERTRERMIIRWRYQV